MKKIIVASLVVLFASSSLALAKEEKNPFDLLWEAVNKLQSKMESLEKQKVQFTINIPDDVSNADVVFKNGELNGYYLKFSVPELNSDNLPQINLYTPDEKENWKLGNTDYISIDDGLILIKFAEEYYSVSEPTSLKDEPAIITSEKQVRFNMTGEHKLVVVY